MKAKTLCIGIRGAFGTALCSRGTMNRSILFAAQRAATTSLRRSPSSSTSHAVRFLSTESPGLPDSVKRVGASAQVPNEYPGQVYAFNWALNADGVTPLKKSAFRITKPLDLKVAGLEQPRTNPLKVDAASSKGSVREAGTDDLSFDTFDEVSQRTKDLLSLSDHLYCPEGHVPGTRITVRVIGNSASLAPSLLAYLERAPKRDPKPQTVTAYVLEGTDEDFAGYAIEEIEDSEGEAKSVAAVVIVGNKPKLETIVAGLELSVEGLLADEEERAKKKAEEKEAAE